ncbi:thioredoxin-like protein 1 [Dendroctonus ponderosae]|uniref:Thioredoxin-like protein 1 n=1 Tax=Dendroctonus ponderosae TaxID=77166 RepID=J3JZI4_DENPD|nr:thioredoxin-like protein 1 [Dendroctonus ponderosae]AEE63623.1 unknown [Dendroctonus ponderosae]ERL89574.1 hypothetical protein D910_06939 [Dendroctonus ponderosae]KAH1015148.1 hypothetical protein HUJ05_012920 [Dendroctonus ponderosae]
MGSVKEITDEANFQAELSNAGTKLVVVDFTATWCGPCRTMSPIFEQLAAKFPQSVFLKVDVDKCQEIAAAQGVSAMPTFIFFRNKVKIARMQGSDSAGLESKIQQYSKASDGEEGEVVAGQMDLSPFITNSECECLNETDDHPLAHALTSGGGFLQSDCDEQLIISITFNQSVKIHSLKFKAPADKGPKHVRIFINQPRTLDFDLADGSNSVQDLVIPQEDLEGNLVNLRFVKFQNVQNIQLFIKDNQSGSDVTQIDHLAFIGSPINTTNMGDFKRVAGKKGESH